MPTKKVILIALSFLAILTVFRFLWLDFQSTPDHPDVSQGELDLSNWEPIDDHSITLDGEWEWFPNTLLMQENVTTDFVENEKDFIQLPDDSVVSADASDTYGYGSYRLRISVDPDKRQTYGIHIPEIISSSEVYVNGELVTRSGNPAEDEQNYKPLNIPQTAYFTLENTSEIELVIQVANYDNPLDSGMIHATTFGLAEPFSQDINLDTNIKILSSIVYLLHALYSFLLFLVGNRDRRLFYFSLMIICVILGALLGDRSLFALFPFNFEWSVKVTFLPMVAGGFFLLRCIRHMLPDFIHAKWLTYYEILCALSVLMILFLPATYNLSLTLFYIAVMLLPCLLASLLIYRTTTRIDKDNIFLLLAVTAAFSSLLWRVFMTIFHFEMGSYPFDLMIAIICFSMFWFKRYFRVLDKSQELTAELQEADERKDDFLVSVAHEMRNPLHGVLNISQSVMEREKNALGEKSRQDLQLLQTVSRQMSSQINDLLDIPRLKENRLSIHPNDVSMHSVTEAVFDMLRYMTEGKPLKLINRIPDNFPPVRADENRLIQIMFNLLHNAVKHAHASEVSVHASIQNGWASISVADTGIGIDESFLNKVFEPYAQYSSGGTSMYSGFGLGLSICKQLVEIHGGTLKVNSKQNEGSVFTFTLPLSAASTNKLTETGVEQSAAAEAADREHVVADQHPSTSSATVRILAVDDDPMNLKILEGIFSTAPYKIHTTVSAHEALSMVNTSEWDLLIADIMMPQMSGYELTRIIRKQFSISELPILLLTARSEPEDIVAGFLSGANDYVTKPIEGMELKIRIDTLTHLKKAIGEQLRLEAAWLQSQIQPHFLFNTLNTIASLSEMDTDRMIKLLNEFGNYLRRSFDVNNAESLTSLESELDLTKSYLYIEKERFGARLNIKWAIEDGFDFHLPPLTIQPLVENAVRHGVLKKGNGGTVTIQVTDRSTHFEIAVMDEGVGMEQGEIRKILEHPHHLNGIGVANTNQRLKKMYGKGLEIESEPGSGTTVRFQIPKNK